MAVYSMTGYASTQATPGPRAQDSTSSRAGVVQGLGDARAREGERLVAVLSERVRQLRTLAAQAVPLVPALVQRQQQRFIERWNEALAAVGSGDAESPRERALTEAAAFA